MSSGASALRCYRAARSPCAPSPVRHPDVIDVHAEGSVNAVCTVSVVLGWNQRKWREGRENSDPTCTAGSVVVKAGRGNGPVYVLEAPAANSESMAV